jgi:hypothetical protein
LMVFDIMNIHDIHQRRSVSFIGSLPYWEVV